MIKLLLGSGLLLAASAATAAPYAVDPLAALPFVTQQLAPQAVAPQYWRIATFAPIATDATNCAAFGWSFAFNATAPTGAGSAPAAAVQNSGELKLWLAAQDGRCVWQHTVEVSNGAAQDVGSLNADLASGRVLAVDAAVQLAQRSARVPVTIESIALSAAAGIITADQNFPTYAVTGTACATAVTIDLNGLSGAVTSRQAPDSCAVVDPAQVLLEVALSDGLAPFGAEGLRIFRDGGVQRFRDAASYDVATLAPARVQALSDTVQALVPGDLVDVTVSSTECPTDVPNVHYRATKTDRSVVLFAEDRYDCHLYELMSSRTEAASLKGALDALWRLPTERVGDAR